MIRLKKHYIMWANISDLALGAKFAITMTQLATFIAVDERQSDDVLNAV